jgi:hypothetical protein
MTHGSQVTASRSDADEIAAEGSWVMGGFRLAGALWIIAGLSSAGLLIFVLDNPVFIALMAGGAIVGLSLGVLLFTRPGPRVVRWSNLAGVAWLIAFGGVSLTQLDRPIGQLFSVLWLTGFGVAAALVAYRRREEASA